jgi:hypothetical protein
MTDWPDQLLPCFFLAARSVTVPVLSIVLTAIGALLLVGLALTYAMRRRDGAAPTMSPSDRRALEDLLADAEELTGRLAANMDAKAARLERLIAQADDRLARLEASPMIEVKPRPDRRPGPPPPVSDTDPLNRRVYELADQGMPPLEIARQLSQQVGHVELILNLRRG